MNGHTRLSVLLVAASICVIFPSIAMADAGVPMLAVVWPLAWFLFIPIVVAEAAVARDIAAISWRQALNASFWANLVSTLIGIPLTWIPLVVLELYATGGSVVLGGVSRLSGKIAAVTAQAPWLIPYEQDLGWMIPAALLFLLPFFGVTSVFIERFIFRKLTKCDEATSTRWSWQAHFLTYGLAMLAVAGWLILAVI